MSDAFATSIFFSVVMLCATFLVWDGRNRKDRGK